MADLASDAEAIGDNNSGTSSEIDSYPPKPPKTRHQNRPKVRTEWTDKNVYKLIAFVRNNAELWEARSKCKIKTGTTRNSRNNLWNDLSKTVFRSRFDPVELAAKWTHLRVQYRNYAHRKVIPGRPVHPIIWRFYRYMQFIDYINEDQVFPEESADSDTEEESDISTHESCSSPPPSLPPNPGTVIAVPASISPNDSDSAYSSQHSVATSNADSIPASAESSSPSSEPPQPSSSEEDSIFSKFLAGELRLLQDSNLARHIKFHVTRYFMDLVDDETGVATSTTPPTSSSVPTGQT